MPRYYCDYCDTYLTHDSVPRIDEYGWIRGQIHDDVALRSEEVLRRNNRIHSLCHQQFDPSVRKQHNAGYKHKANVRSYYQQYEAQLNQSLIDQKVKEHLGAFRPPVAPYNQLRPGMPGMPGMLGMLPPLPGQLPPGAQLLPGMRPPVLPRPMQGYAPPQMPQMVPPPGAPMPGQMNGLQRPVTGPPGPPPMIPGSAGIPTSGAPPMFAPPPMYQGNVSLPTTSGGSEGSNVDAQPVDANQ